MAIIVGLTGGIGSGKTSIMKHIQSLGYKVYFADDAGREILNRQEIIEKITKSFSESHIMDGQKIDRKKLSAVVFNDAEKLKVLNEIIHPAVAKDFNDFINSLSGKDVIVVKESAVLFESGADKTCDYTILVTAPEDIRVHRVMQRDNVSAAEVKNRIRHQMSDAEKSKKADFILENIDLKESFKQIEVLLLGILRKKNKC